MLRRRSLIHNRQSWHMISRYLCQLAIYAYNKAMPVNTIRKGDVSSMKLVQKSSLTAMRPHPDAELYRYFELGIPGINIVCSHQQPHTVRDGTVPTAHVCYVVSGQLTVTDGSVVYQVGPGDAMSFQPMEPRSIANDGDDTAILLLIDKGPGAGGPAPGPGGPGPGGPGPQH